MLLVGLFGNTAQEFVVVEEEEEGKGCAVIPVVVVLGEILAWENCSLAALTRSTSPFLMAFARFATFHTERECQSCSTQTAIHSRMEYETTMEGAAPACWKKMSAKRSPWNSRERTYTEMPETSMGAVERLWVWVDVFECEGLNGFRCV